MGRIEVAAAYLRVLQMMCGERECRRTSLKVIEMCLQQDNLDVGPDLDSCFVKLDLLLGCLS